MIHRPSRLPFARIAAILALGGCLVVPAARAATGCYDMSCATSCSPDPPVEIATVVEPSDFPAGATTPVAFVDPDDGRDRRLVATQQGAILMWDTARAEMLPTPFLDLRDDVGGPVLDGGERGLLALAVDPDYASTGEFYVFYTAAASGPGSEGDVVVERYQRSAADADVADAASAEVILVIEHSSAGNHNGGWLAFGPDDGFLYVSTGDGGGGCDGGDGIGGDGQSADTLAGKILRLDVRGIDGFAGAPDDCGVTAGNYGVPSTNPFFGDEPECDEVWALGLRNPFRFSFDRDTGDLYVGDVGQRNWEEINLMAAATPAPVNFGWVCREGCDSAAAATSSCAVGGCPLDPGSTCEFPRATGGQGGHWDPVLCHYNGGVRWRSIMGGFRYRGWRIPSIAGDYLYSDAYCGQIWKTDTLDPSNPAAISSSCWASGFGGTFGFAEDASGELYVVVGGASRIDCIHNGDGCTWLGEDIFSDGFESGDTSAWSLTVN